MNKGVQAVMNLITIFVLLASLVLVPAVSIAQIPEEVNYQGYLTDAGGPVNGFFDVFFQIFDSSVDGNSLWSETQNVEVVEGIYNVTLGAVSPLNITLDAAVWLQVAIDENGSATIEPLEILSPRQKFSAVPFAINAHRLDGLDSTDFAASTHEHNGSEVSSGMVSQFRIDSAIARDSEIMPEVLLNDGPNSGLNADLLDGKHASDFGDIQAVRAGSGINVLNPESGISVVSVKAPLSLSGGGTDPVIKGRAVSGNAALQGEGAGGSIGELGAWDHAVRGDHSGGNFGTIGTGSFGVHGESAAGTGVFGRSITGVGGKFSSGGIAAILTSGKVGINNNSPSEMLEVGGNVKAASFIGSGTHLTGIRTSNLTGIITPAQASGAIALDSEIVPAVLAADGTGSTLDADLLDGIDSTAFMQGAIYDANADSKVDTAAQADNAATADFAANSDQLDGKDSTFFGDIKAVNAGNGLTGGGLSGEVTLDVEVPLNLTGSSTTDATIKGRNGSWGPGVRGENATGTFGHLGTNHEGARGQHSNGNYGVIGAQTAGVKGESASGIGVYGTATSNGVAARFVGTGGSYGLVVRGNVGINTDNPSTTLDVAGTVKAVNFQGDGWQITNILASNVSGTLTTSNIPVDIARDSEIMPTVLANDGAGSLIDADKLDGLQGSSYAKTADLSAEVLTLEGTISSVTAASVSRDNNEANTRSAADAGHDISINANTSKNNSQDTKIAALEAKVAALEAILAKFSVSADGKQVYIEGANLHVRNGTGTTAGTVNAVGNIIVGYNEDRGSLNDRTGSHNIIAGQQQNYSSYGGIVAGLNNTVSGPYSSVTGGFLNTASGSYASVSGGNSNDAIGDYSSVSGGRSNEATGTYSSASGGHNNLSSGLYSSVSGGHNNIASGSSAAVSGGLSNEATALESSVSGGYNNNATYFYSTVSGGTANTASGSYSTVSGGTANTASGAYSAVSGGAGNNANAPRSAVSGGMGNTASGDSATVSGGATRNSAGPYDWRGGGYFQTE